MKLCTPAKAILATIKIITVFDGPVFASLPDLGVTIGVGAGVVDFGVELGGV
jgi:hypothetical protein